MNVGGIKGFETQDTTPYARLPTNFLIVLLNNGWVYDWFVGNQPNVGASAKRSGARINTPCPQPMMIFTNQDRECFVILSEAKDDSTDCGR